MIDDKNITKMYGKIKFWKISNENKDNSVLKNTTPKKKYKNERDI